MPAVVVVGAQWGDEGKGKIVDMLARDARWVARFQGGNNAGHTLVVAGEKRVLHLLPSGILHPHVICGIGSGVVLDPIVLLREVDSLGEAGVAIGPERLRIAWNTPIILPWHREVDRLREERLGAGKIGTTGRGIGPTYEDSVGRRAIVAWDLTSPERLERALRRIEPDVSLTLVALGGKPLDIPALVAQYAPLGARLAPHMGDVGQEIDAALQAGERVLLEGAQGTMLDVRHGTAPFVTSSHCIAGAACTGIGIGPTRIDRVVGIAKAYCTRVGSGPFPTELHEAVGQRLRDVGREYGATTGRPRRCGWLDLPALRYAVRLSGLTGIFLNKLDVLSGLDEIKLATAYRDAEGTLWPEYPAGLDLTEMTPVYESWPGWQESLHHVRHLEQLPQTARDVLDRIAVLAGVGFDAVSVGPDREETAVIRDSWL